MLIVDSRVYLVPREGMHRAYGESVLHAACIERASVGKAKGQGGKEARRQGREGVQSLGLGPGPCHGGLCERVAKLERGGRAQAQVTRLEPGRQGGGASSQVARWQAQVLPASTQTRPYARTPKPSNQHPAYTIHTVRSGASLPSPPCQAQAQAAQAAGQSTHRCVQSPGLTS